MSRTRRIPTQASIPVLTGHFYWADLNTTDVDGSCAFYEQMLGWTYEELPDVPRRYLSASVNGRQKAAVTGIDPELTLAGVPSHWMPYLWVDDVDATCARARELGGEVVAEPVDVFDMGRMAVLRDPTGGTFGIWWDATPDATVVKDETGSPFWFELHSTDLDRALAFYQELVGWTTLQRDMGGGMSYHLIVPQVTGDEQPHAGGAMQISRRDQEAGIPTSWYAYLQVEDCDASFAQALSLGATEVMAPHDIPGAGRACWVRDPQGAHVPFMHPDPEWGLEH